MRRVRFTVLLAGGSSIISWVDELVNTDIVEGIYRDEFDISISELIAGWMSWNSHPICMAMSRWGYPTTVVVTELAGTDAI